MKITESQLRNIIREELTDVVNSNNKTAIIVFETDSGNQIDQTFNYSSAYEDLIPQVLQAKENLEQKFEESLLAVIIKLSGSDNDDEKVKDLQSILDKAQNEQ
jgi:hypothetical protein